LYLGLQCSNYRESFQYYKIFQIFKNFKCAQNMFFETFQLFGDEKKKSFLENNCLDLGHCIARLILIIWRHVVLYYWHLPIHESIVIETCQSSFLKSEKKMSGLNRHLKIYWVHMFFNFTTVMCNKCHTRWKNTI